MRKFESFLSSVDLRASNGTHPIQHSRIDQDSTEVTRRPLNLRENYMLLYRRNWSLSHLEIRRQTSTDEADLSSNFS